MAEFAKLQESQRERLEMLIEECGEVIQAATKVLRHGYRSYNPDDQGAGSNQRQLQDEILELFTVAESMMIRGDISRVDFYHSRKLWQKKLRYTHHQGNPEDWQKGP